MDLIIMIIIVYLFFSGWRYGSTNWDPKQGSYLKLYLTSTSKWEDPFFFD
jgi:hypothetical protein